jgi:hypothetical protein
VWSMSNNITAFVLGLEYRNFKSAETIIRKGLTKVEWKKNRGDEPIGVIIHIYMELSHGNSLCSYLYLKQAKLSFLLLFYFLFSSTKLENRKAEQILSGVAGGGVGTSGRERGGWERG